MFSIKEADALNLRLGTQKGDNRGALVSTFGAIMSGLSLHWPGVKGYKRIGQIKNSVPVVTRWEKGAFFHKSPTCGMS